MAPPTRKPRPARPCLDGRQDRGQAKRKGLRAFERVTVETCIARGWAQRKLIGGHWALVLTGKGAECVEAAKARRDGFDGR